MFQDIRSDIICRMRWLGAEDEKDRKDGPPRMQRLRQIPEDTGRFLSILAAGAPDGEVIEIGTSGGYSTLWLVLGCLDAKREVTTFEILPDKVNIAREIFRLAGVTDRVKLEHGDALQLLNKYDRIGFCFLDSEKENYQDMYELIIPRLVPGGLLVADNVISHNETLRALVDRAETDKRVDSVVVPIGKGELLCRKI